MFNYEEVYETYSRASEIFRIIYDFSPEQMHKYFFSKNKKLFAHFRHQVEIIDYVLQHEDMVLVEGLHAIDNALVIQDLLKAHKIQEMKSLIRCIVKSYEDDEYKEYSFKITKKDAFSNC